MPEVSELRIAPVKGLGSVSVDRVALGVDGVAEDRRLFLLRENGKVATMRRFPQLDRVVPHLDLSAAELRLSLPDGEVVTADLTSLAEPVDAVLFGKQRSGCVVEDPATQALSRLAGERLRLVLADRAGVGWDEGPVSIVGQASVDAVAVPENGTGQATARFRMLVELSGTDAFEEDRWVGGEVLLGEATVRVTHCLQRCMVIDHRAATGVRDWDGVRALAALDRATLGVIGEVTHPGPVSVGDRVVVRRPSRLPC